MWYKELNSELHTCRAISPIAPPSALKGKLLMLNVLKLKAAQRSYFILNVFKLKFKNNAL